MSDRKTIALNIETMKDPGAEIPELQIKLGNLRDPAKIKEREEEAKASLISKMALSPFTGRVLCITLCSDKGCVTNFSGESAESEAKLIEFVFKKLASFDVPAKLLTFNGANFDIPFLKMRAAILKIDGDVCKQFDYSTNKYKCSDRSADHFDVMQYLHNLLPNDPIGESMSLSYFAKRLLGVDFPYADLDQSKLGELAMSGAEGVQTIQGLCEWNTKRTFEVFKAIEPII